MRKIVALITLILLIPFNNGIDIERIPSKKDVNDFLDSLECKINKDFFFQDCNILQELLMRMDKIEYLENNGWLQGAMAEFYNEMGIEYNQEDIEDFVNKLIFPNDVKNSIALILFSYSQAIKNSKEEQIEGAIFTIDAIRKSLGILMNYKLEENIEGPYGLIMFGGRESSCFIGYKFIIDFGGDEIYLKNSNSFILDLKGNDEYKNQSSIDGVNIVFDADGKDCYNNFPYSCNGTSLLFDIDGSDVYNGSVVVSKENGLSLLFDLEGNDVYIGKNYTQCYSNNGISLLIDFRGNDYYNASSYSQSSTLAGFSALIDFEGDDIFFALDYSQAYATGLYKKGVAAFLNFEGNDFYKAGDYSQGYGENFGVAFIFDFMGEDVYSAVKFSQASASLLGVAALLDADGRNRFSSKLFSQGYMLGGIAFFMNNFEIRGNEDVLKFINYLDFDLSQFFP